MRRRRGGVLSEPQGILTRSTSGRSTRVRKLREYHDNAGRGGSHKCLQTALISCCQPNVFSSVSVASRRIFMLQFPTWASLTSGKDTEVVQDTTRPPVDRVSKARLGHSTTQQRRRLPISNDSACYRKSLDEMVRTPAARSTPLPSC